MQSNLQILILKLINYNSTIMSKAKNTKQTVIQDSSEESDSPLPPITAKSTKKQQLETKKITKVVPKPESSEEEETPVVQKKTLKQVKVQTVPVKKVVPVAKKPAKQESSEEESEEEQPKKVVKAKSPLQKPVVAVKKVAKKETSEQEESEEEKPKKVIKAKSPAQKPIVPKKKVQESSQQSESEEEVPVKAKVSKPTLKAASPALKAKQVVQKAVSKKPAAKVESSDEQEQSEQVVVAKPVQKAKSPLVKAKSPAQKPIVPKKKVQESSQQSEEEEKPAKKVAPTKAKPAKKVEEEEEEEEELEAPKNNNHKKVEAAQIDQEGQFQICVKGLSFQAYQTDVEELFNPFGNVLSVRLLLRDDGKSRGLAFVKFSSKASFNKAIQLNGTEQFGREITVEESLGKQNNGGFQKGGNFKNNNGASNGGSKFPPAGNANIETPTLFIGGLSYNSSQQSISDYFRQVGEVASARIVTDRQTGKPRGFGYVEFHDVDTAKKAYQTLNNGMLDGRQIRLDSAAQRERPQGGFGGGSGGFGGGSGGFGGQRGAPRSSNVNLSQDDKNAKKGSITQFQGKVMNL